MRAERPGFTLVEFLIVAVLSSVVVLAAYEALVIQERVSRTAGAVVRSQDALRTGFGILEAELRELSTLGGAAAGGSDILAATPDSVVVRAPRGVAFVCEILPSDKKMNTWSMGSLFTDDQIAGVFADGPDNTTASDDEWVVADIQSVVNVEGLSVPCAGSPTGEAHQTVTLAASTLESRLGNVFVGAPVRGYEQVAYGIYEFTEGWGLGRRNSDGTVSPIVVGLAGPGTGLVFDYLRADGTSTTDPAQVASIRVTVQTQPRPRSGVDPTTLASTIHLRNN